MSVQSFSRLSFSNTYDKSLQNIQARQAELSGLQENLTTGKKITRPSDDPTGSAAAERALTRLARIATDQRALDSQRNTIATAESTLSDINSTLQSIRELVVSAGDASQTADDRRTVVAQLSGLRDQVLALSNTKDSNGMPLFAALGSALTPFLGPLPNAVDYRFDGLPGVATSTESAIAPTLDGDSTFMHLAQRDGVYNVAVSNGGGSIPADRTLTTTPIRVIDSAKMDGATFSITITGVSTIASPPNTVVEYSVDKTLNGVTTPYITEATTSYVPGGNSKFTLLDSSSYAAATTWPLDGTTGAPITSPAGFTLDVKGTPKVGDTFAVTPNVSIFSTLDHAVKDIGEAGNQNDAIQAVGQALNNIDRAIAQVSATRGRAGDLLNRADRITNNNEKRTIQQEADKSNAEDIDMTKAISDFGKQQTGFQAALQSYAQIQKLSLFNFLG